MARSTKDSIHMRYRKRKSEEVNVNSYKRDEMVGINWIPLWNNVRGLDYWWRPSSDNALNIPFKCLQHLCASRLPYNTKNMLYILLYRWMNFRGHPVTLRVQRLTEYIIMCLTAFTKHWKKKQVKLQSSKQLKIDRSLYAFYPSKNRTPGPKNRSKAWKSWEPKLVLKQKQKIQLYILTD